MSPDSGERQYKWGVGLRFEGLGFGVEGGREAREVSHPASPPHLSPVLPPPSAISQSISQYASQVAISQSTGR